MSDAGRKGPLREGEPHDDRVLELFHPLIRDWFRHTYARPTEIQRRSWPLVASGQHVLLTAPTGSGKTLCAFLWALNQLTAGAWPGGGTRVLYVSPLKALNNDIRRNLVQPLRGIRERFEQAGVPFPEIRVMTRSGDTPPGERQRMLRTPPEILITTPESLNLLLSAPRARESLREIETVILDEIHAVASDKRGTHLITAVERLVLLSGEFQRILLSATVSPLERVAEWAGGYIMMRGDSGGRAERGERGGRGAAAESGKGPADSGPQAASPQPVYIKRRVAVVRAAQSKKIEVGVRFPESGYTRGKRDGGARAGPTASTGEPSAASPGPFPALEPAPSAREAFWNALVAECKARIRRNRATLIFTNTRRLAEKLARLLNEGEDSRLAYAHHGSLSKEVRLLVEQKLKAGELAAIVATGSLELGIDIGELDEVLLVQTPFSVASSLQRIGRAGHGVGQVSRGTLFPTHGRDLLDAALMAASVVEQDIEEVRPVDCPLDLLAQIILSMTAVEPWRVDELYDTLRCSAAYHGLSRQSFEMVLEMLAGRFQDSFIRELRPRISWDRLEGTVQARRGSLPLVYRSGGTIPDRGYFDLRVRQTAAKIGELDEEFVWERKVGDTFNLGTQSWKIVRIDSRSVEVIPWDGPISITPFWKAEKAGRDFHYGEKVGLFLERWQDRLADPELEDCLLREHFLDPASVRALISFLQRQKAATGRELPHRHHLLIEHVDGSPAQASLYRIILHTLWGARVNYPFSLILEAAWKRQHGSGLEVFADDDCLMIIPSEPQGFDVYELLSLARPARVEELLRESLEGSGYFGARFRENAGRALLVPRSDLNRRIPLWLTRLRSRKLLETVVRYPEFPVLLETWRSCLRDEFDLPSLKMLLAELSAGEIRTSEARTSFPSPFADFISWIQTNQHVYEGDVPAAAGSSAVQTEVIRQILYSSQLRPRIDPELAAELQVKLQRCAPGYAPAGVVELLDWVKERLIIPEAEWQGLEDAVERDHALQAWEVEREIGGKLLRYRLAGADTWAVSALELMPRVIEAFSEVGEESALQLIESLEVPEAGRSLPAYAWLREELRRRELIPAEEPEAPQLPALLGEWLRFYAPLPLDPLCRLFGLSRPRLEALLDALIENGSLILDRLTRGSEEAQICDAENLEILLRLTRKGARPAFRALSLEQLPLFLAAQQGLVGDLQRPESSPEDLKRVLETLFGYPAPVRLWEEQILPARLSPYYSSWLDGLLQQSELEWIGCGRERSSFCFSSDREFFLDPPAAEDRERARLELSRLLPSPKGKFSFWDLVDHSGDSPAQTSARIWQLVWSGYLAADSFEVLRKGAAQRFAGPAEGRPAGRQEGSFADRQTGRLAVRSDPARSRPGRRRKVGYDRWRASHPFSGSWYSLGSGDDAEPDLLEEQELSRDRVRQLLRRYGILTKEILTHELSPLRWLHLFRTLRLMELSGEVLSGHFFEGIPGPQFISHAAFRILEKGLPMEAVYWISALDPVSPCGLGLPLPYLPPRLATSHLVFHGPRLLLVSKSRGREVEILAEPEDTVLPRCFRLFSDQLSRDRGPWKSVRVEKINDLPARESPYRQAFLDFGFTEEYRGLTLRAGY